MCDTSFEQVKTALLRGGDFLDCISVPLEKIRLALEPLSPGICALIMRTDRVRIEALGSMVSERKLA